MPGTTLENAFTNPMMPFASPSMLGSHLQQTSQTQPQQKTTKSTPIKNLANYNPLIETITQQEVHGPEPKFNHPVHMTVPGIIGTHSFPYNMPQEHVVDKWITNKRSITKMMTFVTMLVLAIALFTLLDFWLKETVAKYLMSFKHELGLRIILVVALFIILVILKNSSTASHRN